MPIRIIVHLAFLITLAGFLLAWNQVGAPKTLIDVASPLTEVESTSSQGDGPLSPSNAVRLTASVGLSTRTQAQPNSGPQGPAQLVKSGAVPVYIHDRGFVTEVDAPAKTVADSLNIAGVGARSADRIYPPVGSPVSAGMHVHIQRAKHGVVEVDGKRESVFSFVETVADLLKEAHVEIAPVDRVSPSLAAPFKDNMTVQVTRVKEEEFTLDIPIPYQTSSSYDDELEFGVSRVDQAGENGVKREQVRVVYENGQEVRRILQKTWVVAEPTSRQVRVGAQIVPKVLMTADGPMQYWRTMTVWATWYSPASSGTSPIDPNYGITRSGLPAQKGVIAVDPRVIPLWSQLYVPGYGVGIAGDTGGGIRGKIIDLAYADDDTQDWLTGPVEIYFLGPGPSPSELPFYLPLP